MCKLIYFSIIIKIFFMTQFIKNLFVLINILSIFFISCKNSSNNEVNNNKKEEISPLKDTVYVINKTDTIFIEKQAKKVSEKEVIDSSHINKKKTIVNPLETKIKIERNNKKEEIIYYKSTTKISTKITPWVDGTRYIRLYDRNGNQTYEIEDENKSYSSITNLRYNNDGSVIDATTNLNPGASMNWYVTTTKFKEDNQPTFQESIEYPQKLSAIVEGSRLKVWDSQNKKWVPKSN